MMPQDYPEDHDQDLKTMFATGFWVGALSGGMTVFVVLLLLGLYVK